jgi:hypothetical protein
LLKLKDNKYDVSTLTPEELENIQRYAPALLEACNKFVQEGVKAQEKVYSIINQAIEIFEEQLKAPNLSPEERDKLNDRIERMVEKAIKKDTELKNLIMYSVLAGVGGAALFFAGKNQTVRNAALNYLKNGRF